jgi:hypothetical protein
MSVKIEQLIEVIEEIKEEFKLNPNAKDISSLRRQATKAITARIGRHKTTIPDKFIRGLRPDIDSTSRFDRHLEQWLFNNSPDLENILLKHGPTESDRKRIRNAFFVAPEQDVVLAHQFGFDPNEQSFKEGKEKFRLHRDKERNPNLVRQAKEKWMSSSNGNLSCTVCDFSFPRVYGNIGIGFIEAHHRIPISSLKRDTVIKISDLAPVCSNCHSMLHRNHNTGLSVEQLRETINQQKSKFAG